MKIAKLTRWIKPSSIYVFYSAAALAILLPLLASGYILTLDMVFTPKLRMPDAVTSSYVFHAGLHYLNLIVPSQVIEKLMLFLILLLSGLGMHRLMRWLQRADRLAAPGELGAYFAGLLYMINPFTYSRFMAGQYAVLLGYALLPWFVRALLVFLERPASGSVIRLAAWAVAASIVSIHSIGLMLTLSVIALGLSSWRLRRHRQRLGGVVRYGSLGIVIYLIASSYWLVALLLGHSTTAQSIATFRTTNQQAFATVGGSTLGKLANVSHLQGFWAEGQNLYLLPQDMVRPWGLFALTVWGLVITGGISCWRRRQRFVLGLFGLGALIGGWLAVGVYNGWLVRDVPLFAGYREPQKFMALVAIGYAVLAGWGVKALAGRYFRRSKLLVLGFGAVLLALLIGFTPVMFRGFDGQLVPRQYPADWAVMNQRLDADHANYTVLFLPWHLYMRFQFAGRVIANPAEAFFDRPIIMSNNPEFGAVTPAVPDTQKQLLTDHILPAAPQGHDLGRQLVPLRVKYILLDKDYDYQRYAYLDRQTDLRLVSQGPTLRLYRNTALAGD